MRGSKQQSQPQATLYSQLLQRHRQSFAASNNQQSLLASFNPSRRPSIAAPLKQSFVATNKQPIATSIQQNIPLAIYLQDKLQFQTPELTEMGIICVANNIFYRCEKVWLNQAQSFFSIMYDYIIVKSKQLQQQDKNYSFEENPIYCDSGNRAPPATPHQSTLKKGSDHKSLLLNIKKPSIASITAISKYKQNDCSSITYNNTCFRIQIYTNQQCLVTALKPFLQGYSQFIGAKWCLQAYKNTRRCDLLCLLTDNTQKNPTEIGIEKSKILNKILSQAADRSTKQESNELLCRIKIGNKHIYIVLMRVQCAKYISSATIAMQRQILENNIKTDAQLTIIHSKKAGSDLVKALNLIGITPLQSDQVYKNIQERQLTKTIKQLTKIRNLELQRLQKLKKMVISIQNGEFSQIDQRLLSQGFNSQQQQQYDSYQQCDMAIPLEQARINTARGHALHAKIK